VRPEPSLAYGDGALAASLASSGFSPPAFAARYSGYLRVPSAGPYRIALRSDDGSRLFLDGAESVSNDGVHDASERSFETWLEAGDHPLLVEYFDNGGRGELSLCWESDAFAREPVPASALLHAPWDVPPAPPPPAGFAWGAEASFCGLADALSAMPVLAGLAPDFTGTVARIDYPATASAWDGLPAGMADRFAAVFEGGLFVPESGLYALALGSDDGASLEIDGVEVFADDGVHSYSVRSAALPLGAGVHPFRVRYFENAGEAGLSSSPRATRTPTRTACPTGGRSGMALMRPTRQTPPPTPTTTASRTSPNTAPARTRIPPTATPTACPTPGRSRTAFARS